MKLTLELNNYVIQLVEAELKRQQHNMDDPVALSSAEYFTSVVRRDLAKAEENLIKDRFFLEEIVHRMKRAKITDDYVTTLTRDWLYEMVESIHLTEDERTKYLNEVLGNDQDFQNEAYFGSEHDLHEFLGMNYSER